ncbi:gliding motility-associated ABC transporter ATP-binding subunit GldA [Echinicola vietnamensis]|uniref:Gliding motility-associated ABC transporter ATP-binding subunit GldA n=1 Tax=Echinicola vietnamensis (strain DSM 17526 / LMG 23754 / KMM 6221) TaxID=926556 RepID=L0FV17_ECHVK|nr:gliding motility-associated ABC transporter ATP-binding subunit GldA [Echinicola vietnamensis]AGA76591.1 gliding motility-associated ABC transporter ATP-binding subunit GldA [Echinicola vietnamensis DSM 17526]
MSLEVKELSKYYGQQRALKEVSFTAEKGQVLGFLGPNGAGKSTTMKIAAGYLLPDGGDVLVNGVSVMDHPQEVSKMIGYLPEHNPLYLEMYVREFLSFMAGLYQLKGKKAKARIDGVVEACGLGDEQHKKIGALSKGYRQRVGLAKALVHDPAVIILDEPTSGLDPNQLVDIRKLIKSISAEKTLVLSTHVMQEVEALCEKVVIIHQGNVVSQDLLANLKSDNSEMVLYLETQERLREEWFAAMEGLGELHVLGDGYFQLKAVNPTILRKEIMELISEKSLSLLSLRQEERNLESIFRQLTGTKE